MPQMQESMMTVPEVELFDIRFSNVSFDDLCEVLDARIQRHEPGYIVTPNVDHVCMYQKHAGFREAYQGAALVVPDGKPIMWAARLLGKPLREKLSGSDLVDDLSRVAAEKGYSVFLLGAAEGVGTHAAELLQERYPGLNIVGVYSPPLGFHESETDNRETLEKVRAMKPDICFVALGGPLQELWMHQYFPQSGATIMLGIGAGLDFVAGRKKRAPRWMQRAGCEWIWRLACEPRRLWKRYLVDDMQFVPIVLRELQKSRRTAHEPS